MRKKRRMRTIRKWEKEKIRNLKDEEMRGKEWGNEVTRKLKKCQNEENEKKRKWDKVEMTAENTT